MGLTCDEISTLVASERAVDKARAWDALAEKNAEIARLKAELERRTSERDYHTRVADQLADRIRSLANGERHDG
jgi:hypothetical protein